MLDSYDSDVFTVTEDLQSGGFFIKANKFINKTQEVNFSYKVSDNFKNNPLFTHGGLDLKLLVDILKLVEP